MLFKSDSDFLWLDNLKLGPFIFKLDYLLIWKDSSFEGLIFTGCFDTLLPPFISFVVPGGNKYKSSSGIFIFSFSDFLILKDPLGLPPYFLF